ncbi:MAG: hypothetical protein ACEQSE_00275 [Candidatus Aquirickettsiella gammari]
MPQVYEINDVPEAKLLSEENILRQDGAIDVKHEKQANGLYKIIATFPDT